MTLITGGSRGIGEAIVEKFASEGSDIAFTYMSSAERAEEIASNMSTLYGVKVIAYQSDASKFDEAQKLVEEVNKEFGKVDTLINNAGITKDTLMLRMSEEQWDRVIEVNLKSVFNQPSTFYDLC